MPVTRPNKVAYGFSEPLPTIFAAPIVAVRAPTGRDRAEIGTLWVNTTDNTTYILTSVAGGVSVWTGAAGGAGIFTALGVTPGPVQISSTFVDIVGTNAIADAIELSATNAAGGIVINSGTGGINIDSTGDITIDALGSAQLTSAGVGNTATLQSFGSTVVINGATGVGIDGNDLVTIQTSNDPGNIQIDAGVDTAAGLATTIDAWFGISTHTGLTTAAAAAEVITITCDKALVTSGIIASASNLGLNDAQMTVTRIEPLAGAFEVTVLNNGTQALNGNLVISFMILT